MESIKVIKKLGSGVIGTTYLLSINNKHHVGKIEKILEKNIVYDTSYSFWREIEFSKFANTYPEHFMTLKSWSITKDCNHKQPTPPLYIQGKHRKDLIDINNSTYCSILIYEPALDNTLR